MVIFLRAFSISLTSHTKQKKKKENLLSAVNTKIIDSPAGIMNLASNPSYSFLAMNSNDFDNLSGEEEFHEDALNNEEYDLLYELLPKVREEMEQYNSSVDELSMKEALYYNYFELEPALEELRKKFPKKKGMLRFF